jgi:hypothetical protein
MSPVNKLTIYKIPKLKDLSKLRRLGFSLTASIPFWVYSYSSSFTKEDNAGPYVV